MADKKLEDFILHHREDFDTESPRPGIWEAVDRALLPETEAPDALETFVAKHRDQFDDVSPPPRLRESVLATAAPPRPVTSPAPPLRANRRRRLFPIVGIAATGLLLIIAAFLLGNSQGHHMAEEDLVAAQLARLEPELAEAELYYEQEIASQFLRVKQVNNDPQLVADLEEIDRAKAEVRADLLKVPPSQRAGLVTDLINIHRTKLDILLRIQRRIPTAQANQPAPSGTQKSNDEI